jgi:hypothetical protein
MHSEGTAQTQSTTGSSHYRRGQLPTLDDQLKKLTTELNLDPLQQSNVKAILDRRQIQLMRVRNDASLSAVDRFYAMKAVHEKADEQIRAILNADQASKFDQLHPRPVPKSETRGPSNEPAH